MKAEKILHEILEIVRGYIEPRRDSIYTAMGKIIGKLDPWPLPLFERHRHIKTGGIYEIIGDATPQCEAPLPDMASVIVYQGPDGRIWARPHAEFAERFSIVNAGQGNAERLDATDLPDDVIWAARLLTSHFEKRNISDWCLDGVQSRAVSHGNAEDLHVAASKHLNCPACGGSGHIDDVPVDVMARANQIASMAQPAYFNIVRAMVLGLQEGGWLPINTAPKDDSVFIVGMFEKLDDGSERFNQAFTHHENPSGPHPDRGWNHRNGPFGGHATHWSPMKEQPR